MTFILTIDIFRSKIKYLKKFKKKYRMAEITRKYNEVENKRNQSKSTITTVHHQLHYFLSIFL
jgi:hypothetical protein